MNPLDQLAEHKRQEHELVVFLQASWTQRQLDDLLMMNQQVTHQLKGNPFKVDWRIKQEKIQRDIDTLQKIVLDTGISAAKIIEEKYGVTFYLLSGRNIPPENKPLITLPGNEGKT